MSLTIVEHPYLEHQFLKERDAIVAVRQPCELPEMNLALCGIARARAGWDAQSEFMDELRQAVRG